MRKCVPYFKWEEIWVVWTRAHISLSQCTCFIVRDGALGTHQSGSTHFAALWWLMWGRGQRGNNAVAGLSAGFQSFPLLPTSKLGLYGADSRVGGFVNVLGPCGSLQWTLLWGQEFLPLPPQHPQVFTTRSFQALVSQHWNPGLCRLSRSPIVPPGYLHVNVGPLGLPVAASPALSPLPCHASSPPQLPVSAPPTGLDECFFFDSLVIRLPYSLSVLFFCF